MWTLGPASVPPAASVFEFVEVSVWWLDSVHLVLRLSENGDRASCNTKISVLIKKSPNYLRSYRR